MRRAILLVVVGLLAGSCSSDPTTTDEYVALQAELDAAEESVAALQGTVEELDGLRDDLRAEREAREDAEAALADAQTAIADAQAEIASLRLQYDEDIRADLRVAYETEVARACTVASEDASTSIASTVRWDGDWSVLGLTREDLVAAVSECSLPAREALSLTQAEADVALRPLVDDTMAFIRDRGDSDEFESLVRTTISELVKNAVYVDADAEWVALLQDLADFECRCATWEAASLIDDLRAIGVANAPLTLAGGDRTVGDREEDAKPGVYVGYHVEGCYWERLDSRGEIIDNNFVNAAPRVQVTIRSSDFAFNSSDCAPWFKQ